MRITTSEIYPDCTILDGNQDSVEYLQKTIACYLEKGYDLVHFSAVLMKPDSSTRIDDTIQLPADEKPAAEPPSTKNTYPLELRGNETRTLTHKKCWGFKLKEQTCRLSAWNRLVFELCEILANQDKRKLLSILSDLPNFTRRCSTDQSAFHDDAFPVKILDSNMFINIHPFPAKDVQRIAIKLIREFGYAPEDLVFLYTK